MNPVQLSTDLEWRYATIADQPQWDRFVEQHSSGRLGHLYHFGSVVERSYGFVPFRFVVQRRSPLGGTAGLCGLLMLSLVRRVGRRDRLVSVPFHEYGGIIASGDAPRELLTDAVHAEARLAAAGDIEFRGIEPRAGAHRWSERREYVRIALRDAESMYDEVFASPLRRSLAKADRASVTVRKLEDWAHIEESFYPLYKRGLRRIGAFPHRLRFFRDVWGLLRPHAQFWLASRGGVPLVAMTAYYVGETLHVVDLARADDVDRFGAGDAIHWEIMKWGCEHGARVFDFGPAGSAGTRRYKLKWGGEVVARDDVRFFVSEARPAEVHAPDRPTASRPSAFGVGRRFLREVIRVLPDPLWTRAGSRVRGWSLR